MLGGRRNHYRVTIVYCICFQPPLFPLGYKIFACNVHNRLPNRLGQRVSLPLHFVLKTPIVDVVVSDLFAVEHFVWLPLLLCSNTTLGDLFSMLGPRNCTTDKI